MKVKPYKNHWAMSRKLNKAKPAKVYHVSALMGEFSFWSGYIVANNALQARNEAGAMYVGEGRGAVDPDKMIAVAIADVEFPEQTPIELLTACEGPKEFINRQTGTRHTTQPAEDTYAHFAPVDRTAERQAKLASLRQDGLGWMLYPENHQDGCPFPGDCLKDCTCKPGACIG